jgi:hypothetical protein
MRIRVTDILEMLAGGASPDVLAVAQKTASAVLRRLVAKGVVRRQARADETHVWEGG